MACQKISGGKTQADSQMELGVLLEHGRCTLLGWKTLGKESRVKSKK